MRVLHVINDLGQGGAQHLLRQAMPILAGLGVESRVVTLLPGSGRVHDPSLDPIVHRSSSKWASPREVNRTMAKWKPQVIHTWLPQADILGGVLGRAHRVPVLWSIHRTREGVDTAGVKGVLMDRAIALASHVIPDAIVSCSNRAAADFRSLHARSADLHVVQNGFDVDHFRPDSGSRGAWRARHGYMVDDVVIVVPARWHPQKGHVVMLDAMTRVVRKLPNVQLVMLGEGVNPANEALVTEIRNRGLADSVRLLGIERDMQEIMRGADVCVLPSVAGEAFPLVLGEALASGTVCVATDVGDSAEVVSRFGRVVPPRDAEALSGAILELCLLDRGARVSLGLEGRQWVRQRWDIREMAQSYCDIYASLLR